ncbi:MAG: alpha/beta fold hydrolase [Rhodospirillaceae bacterium]|nr:alpha/beta fold hydrolase [Rhodospirillaceae bacterium]MBT6088990.1 alpha/beta fold hydrolase [Rhodospirillaceae bacterium]
MRPTSPVRRGYADTSFGQIHYYDAAAKDLPALLLLHQSPQAGNMFEAALPILGEHFRTIALDTLGYGLSDKPDRVLEPEDYAQSIIEVADALDLNSFAVCGAHTGATFAIQLAIQYSDRVSALVLSGPPLHPPLAPGASRRKPQMKPPPPPREDGTHLTELWQARWKVAAPIDPKIFQRRFLTAVMTGASSISAYHAVYKYDLTERLKLVSCPILIVYGDRDVETPNIQQVLPLIPDIPTQVIPDGNIYTVDVCTKAWCTAVGDFCSAALA